MTDIRLIGVEAAKDIAAVRGLFLEYAESLPFDLGYQNFADEIAEFPGQYAPPKGGLILARVDGATAGAVGLRPLDAAVGEIKRLYVRPDYRGLGLGAKLVDAIVGCGRRTGYAALRLDTIRGLMEGAEILYRRRGFIEIAAYYENPMADAVYYELRLN